jgi:hypothetical protein
MGYKAVTAKQFSRLAFPKIINEFILSSETAPVKNF